MQPKLHQSTSFPYLILTIGVGGGGAAITAGSAGLSSGVGATEILTDICRFIGLRGDLGDSGPLPAPSGAIPPVSSCPGGSDNLRDRFLFISGLVSCPSSPDIAKFLD